MLYRISAMSFKKNDPKTIRGWVMYDWANSVYSLTIATAVFPIYFVEVLPKEVSFLGINFTASGLFSYCVSFAFLVIAFVSPLLSGIADFKDSKQKFMKFFVYLGSISCAALYFFTGESSLYMGVIPFVLATIAFAGSLVFYNAYLHEIVTPDKMDSVSAKGFSMGYIGSVLLLIINLLIIMMPETFGIAPNSALPSQIAFVSVGLWWAGFSQITFNTLPKEENKHPNAKGLIFKGYQELNKVLKQLKELRNLKLFLTSFFVYSMALQTVMYVASLFGKEVVKLETAELIITVLIIQLVAIGGAYLFSRLSAKLGNIMSITIALAIWILIGIGAFFLKEGDTNLFYILGAMVGIVMGGSQAISRSSYAKLLPTDTEDHASFFSFYDVAEKLSIVIGTFIWGFIDNLFGIRNGLFALVVFFIIGIILLQQVKDDKLKPTA